VVVVAAVVVDVDGAVVDVKGMVVVVVDEVGAIVVVVTIVGTEVSEGDVADGVEAATMVLVGMAVVEVLGIIGATEQNGPLAGCR